MKILPVGDNTNRGKKEIGSRMGHYYTPKQVRIIFEELGVPADAVAGSGDNP